MFFAGWLVRSGYTLLLKIVKHLDYFSVLTDRSFSRDL